jgi:hypothetical protein
MQEKQKRDNPLVFCEGVRDRNRFCEQPSQPMFINTGSSALSEPEHRKYILLASRDKLRLDGSTSASEDSWPASVHMRL